MNIIASSLKTRFWIKICYWSGSPRRKSSILTLDMRKSGDEGSLIIPGGIRFLRVWTRYVWFDLPYLRWGAQFKLPPRGDFYLCGWISKLGLFMWPWHAGVNALQWVSVNEVNRHVCLMSFKSSPVIRKQKNMFLCPSGRSKLYPPPALYLNLCQKTETGWPKSRVTTMCRLREGERRIGNSSPSVSRSTFDRGHSTAPWHWMNVLKMEFLPHLVNYCAITFLSAPEM